MVKVKLKNGTFVTLDKGSKEEGSFYIDGLLQRNLDSTKKIIRNDWD